MVLSDFAMIAADTARSKAYIQAMIQGEKLPAMCIIYSENCKRMEERAEIYEEEHYSKKYFDVDCPIIFSLRKANIPYILVENKNINSEQMAGIIGKCREKYLIYSGYGGEILKKPLFQLDKKFIHIHAGILPEYRGSTTFYFSYLQEKQVGATAIFLNEKIDCGEIITQNTYELPQEMVDTDYIYEPYIRSRVLMDVLNKYVKEGELVASSQENERAEDYFIIHPVLKHVALLDMGFHEISGE
jgi:Methionyl-tRNA formyltransferase